MKIDATYLKAHRTASSLGVKVWRIRKQSGDFFPTDGRGRLIGRPRAVFEPERNTEGPANDSGDHLPEGRALGPHDKTREWAKHYARTYSL